jgi:thiol-disulfide isomerase/thioredoxin
MKTRFWTTGAAFALAAIGLVGAAALKAPAARADATGAVPKVDNFRLTTADRQSYELYRMKDDAAVVLVTQADGCGPLRAAAPALKQLGADYAGKGVDVLMLNSSLKDTSDQAVAEAASAGYDAPILMDAQQLVGEQLAVTSAGEAIILNPKTWSIAWRGPVADAPGAVAAVVAGREPAASAKPVSACPVAFPGRAKAAQFAKISYTKDVAPIIQTKCVECHEPGGIGPMPLTSYEKVKGFAPMIREVIRTQRMPPWHANPDVGHFLDDDSLSADQKRTLVHWIEAGALRGTGDDPLTKVSFKAPEWPLGTPDEIIDVPAYTIPANGIVNYQRPFAANPATEGKWLRASTFQIDQRQAVHHILTGYIANPPKSGTEATESLWGTTLGTFAVGTNPMQMPKDLGAYIPAGGAIGFQNHYTPFGKEVVAHSKIGLYFYKEQPKLIMRTNTIIDPTITIPANTERHKEIAYLTFPHDGILYGAFIHSHYRGSASELKILYPDGKSKLLISIPKYDFNWQRDYSFETPVDVPAGSRLVATYVYDNSKRNPANPDSNRVVPWGEQSFDEMFYTTLRYRWTDETSSDQAVGKAHDAEMMGQRNMGIFDDNLDGVIQKSELKGKTGEALLARFDLLDTNHDGVLDMKELMAAQKAMGARPQTAEAAPATQNR